MSVQYFYEVSSPSFHMVPHTPFIRKPSTTASSPVATVPDVDTNRIIHIKEAGYIGRQSHLFTPANSSPLPTGRVPSLSPRTPLNASVQPQEQQVPSQTPLLLKKENLSKVLPLDLFTDDDSIFL